MRNLAVPLLATIFNLFFEYSLRGVNGLLANPTLIIFLFLVYFLWFVLLEDVIRRFKPSDLKTMLLPYIGIGTIFSLLFIPIRAFFTPPLFLGINVGLFIYITFFWWTLLQTIMALYFANRLMPRTVSKPILGKRGWIVVGGSWLVVGLLFRIQIPIPQISPITYFSVLMIALAALILFKKWHPKVDSSQPSRFMDLLTGATAIFFIICAFSFSSATHVDFHPINVDALKPVVAWTTISGVLMLAYRFITKKPFMV